MNGPIPLTQIELDRPAPDFEEVGPVRSSC